MVVKLATGLQVIIGFIVFIYAVMQAVSNYRGLWTINTFHSVILAPLLSILFAPFIYLMLVCTAYETFFALLKMEPEKPKDLQRYAKRRLIRHLGLKPANIRAFQRAHHLDVMHIKTRDDVDRLLRG
jgi:hypothetical protein